MDKNNFLLIQGLICEILLLPPCNTFLSTIYFQFSQQIWVTTPYRRLSWTQPPYWALSMNHVLIHSFSKTLYDLLICSLPEFWHSSDPENWSQTPSTEKQSVLEWNRDTQVRHHDQLICNWIPGEKQVQGWSVYHASLRDWRRQEAQWWWCLILVSKARSEKEFYYSFVGCISPFWSVVVENAVTLHTT